MFIFVKQHLQFLFIPDTVWIQLSFCVSTSICIPSFLQSNVQTIYWHQSPSIKNITIQCICDNKLSWIELLNHPLNKRISQLKNVCQADVKIPCPFFHPEKLNFENLWFTPKSLSYLPFTDEYLLPYCSFYNWPILHNQRIAGNQNVRQLTSKPSERNIATQWVAVA